MNWTAFFEILLFGWFSVANEEVVLFDVILDDEVVGEVKAVKTTTGTQTTYHSFTHIETRLITSVEVEYSTRAVYDGQVLNEAEVSLEVNGKTFTDTHTKLVDDTYRFYKNGKLKKTLDKPIRYSSIQLIFEEPAQITAAYSEDSGGFYTIEQTEKNIYEKINSRGKKSIYQYQNQALKSIEVDAGLVKFEMVLKK